MEKTAKGSLSSGRWRAACPAGKCRRRGPCAASPSASAGSGSQPSDGNGTPASREKPAGTPLRSRRRYRCTSTGRRTQHPWAVQHVERLADVGGLASGSQHFAYPGGAGAVRAGDEDGALSCRIDGLGSSPERISILPAGTLAPHQAQQGVEHAVPVLQGVSPGCARALAGTSEAPGRLPAIQQIAGVQAVGASLDAPPVCLQSRLPGRAGPASIPAGAGSPAQSQAPGSRSWRRVVAGSRPDRRDVPHRRQARHAQPQVMVEQKW